jgi:hypothetical protein
MKKQLLIAAVAATMTSAAMADISITGAAKVNYTYSDTAAVGVVKATTTSAFKREMDLKITGKSGATTVVMNFGNDVKGSAGLVTEDSYVSTTVGDISLKAGTWSNGNNQMRAKARDENKFSASTSFNGVKVAFDSQNESNGTGTTDAVTLSGDISGVAVKFKEEGHKDSYSVSTTIAGVKVAQSALNSDTANSDKVMTSIGGSFNGVNVTYTTIKADSAATINGEGILQMKTNTAAGADVAFLQLSTTIAGNSVSFMNADIDADVAGGKDVNVKEITVTRAMAAGTTFEATYTMESSDDANVADVDTLDLELAVKF